MQPVCAPEMEVQPDFKVDCPAKFRSCNSFITQLVNAPGMAILLPRCYICPSGSVPTTLSQAAEQKRLDESARPLLVSMFHLGCSNENGEDRNTKRSCLMSAGLGPAARVCVMMAIRKDGVLCSGSVPAIDQKREEKECIAVVNHQWGEEKINANDLLH